MNRTLLHNSILIKTSMTFARASGAGGQNVNKVNTKVHATIKLEDIEGLNEEEINLLRQRLNNNINSDGYIFIDVQDERYQERNRENAIKRLEEKIIGACFIPKKRKKTKPTKASKEKRLKIKNIRSEIKKNRQKII